jgi:histidinol phosphatase-like enzyme (inositol monophosphatase family)
VDDELELDWIAPLLDEAGEIALRWFRTAIVAQDKGGPAGYDPVTEADRGIEDLLRSRLSERYADHQIVGEEAGVSGPDGRYRWLIDPIDGTKTFVTGSPLWGVLLGLLDDGRPVAGWMHQPYIGETFAAVGGEAWLRRGAHRRRLETRRDVALADAAMYTTFPGMFTNDDDRAAFTRLSDAVRLARFGGDCYAYCLIALGQVDLVVEASLQPYDIVPLIPIVEAAGGVVTGRHGESAVDGGFVIAAATPEIHAEALALIDKR